jgi:hypothetical protein
VVVVGVVALFKKLQFT